MYMEFASDMRRPSPEGASQVMRVVTLFTMKRMFESASMASGVNVAGLLGKGV